MAGAKVPAPLDPMVNGDDWTNILARYNRTVKGSEGVSLTNWVAGNTDRPEIAAGSVIEIDGAPFEYATDETIVDGAGLTDGWCYIKHVVSGDAVTPTLTNTFGTWDTAKQGFYDGGDRFSLFAMYRSGAIIKIFTEKAMIKLSEAVLGFRYYEKQYTGTTDNTGYYGINITDSIFTPTEFYSTDAGWINYAGNTWVSSQGIGGSGLQTKFLGQVDGTGGISFVMATYYSTYGNKPYKILVKYKLTL